MTKTEELLREIVAYCREAGHNWSNLSEAESLLQAAEDDAAVDRFATAMKERLACKRLEGLHGWQDPKWVSDESLITNMLQRARAGKYVGLANFAMMLHERGVNPARVAAHAGSKS